MLKNFVRNRVYYRPFVREVLNALVHLVIAAALALAMAIVPFYIANEVIEVILVVATMIAMVIMLNTFSSAREKYRWGRSFAKSAQELNRIYAQTPGQVQAEIDRVRAEWEQHSQQSKKWQQESDDHWAQIRALREQCEAACQPHQEQISALTTKICSAENQLWERRYDLEVKFLQNALDYLTAQQS